MQRIFKKIHAEKRHIQSIFSTSILGSAVSLIMTFAFANLMSPAKLGIYQYIISVVSIIGVISCTGALNAIIRATSRNDFYFLPVAHRLLWQGFIVGSLAACVVGAYYAFQGNVLLGASIISGSLLYLLIQVLYRHTSLFTALNEHPRVHTILKFHAIAPLIFVLPFLFTTNNPYVLTTLYFAGNVCAFIGGIWWTNLHTRERDILKNIKLEDKKLDRAYILYSIHQSIITLINTFAVNIDKIIIFQLLGPAQTAIYYIVTSIPNRLRGILKQFDAFLFARFARHAPESAKHHMRYWLYILLLLIAPIYIIYALFVETFFSFFLSPYVSYSYLTIIYGLTLFAIVEMFPRSTLKAHAQNKTLYIVSLMTYGIHTTCILIGIYTNGLQGAVIGATISKLTIAFMTYAIGKNHTPTHTHSTHQSTRVI